MNVTDLNSFYETREPFSTHVPLLRAVGPSIKTVLELGAGLYSTAIFLDTQHYPNLEELVSVEQNPDWVIDSKDPRHKIVIVPEPIETYLDTVDLNHFDLILVDNSTFGERRCETLRYIGNRVGRSLVVAHDYDVPSYKAATYEFTNAIVDDRQVPHTALLWRSR